MHRSASIPVIVEGREVTVPRGTTAGEVLARHATPGAQPPLSALVAYRWVDLDFPVTAPARVDPVDYTSRLGVLAYRRTASLMLLVAARRVFGRARVTVGQAEGNGYFYHVEGRPRLADEAITALRREMDRLVAEDARVEVRRVPEPEARRIFAEAGAVEKLRIIDALLESEIPLVRLEDFWDIHHYPAAPRASLVSTFALERSNGGLILRFPPRGAPQPVAPFESDPKLEATYEEARIWLERLGIQNAGDLNRVVQRGQAGEVIRIAEGLHEKRIAQIADRICAADGGPRLVLIAGPSSSGKTTFSKRLSLQLRVNGVRPVALSTDSFYVNRVDTPRDEAGEYDFERIDAIDLDLFNDVLRRLLAGEEVQTPRFDFTRGERMPRDRWRPMRLAPGEVLIVEGIHGLNPRLTAAVPEQHKFRIYINALTQLCIDDHNRLFTSDTRLIRRIVRDRLFRGYGAAETLARWASVRRGEMRDIFPYQGRADVMFNSALVYEAAVLRLYAARFLHEVPRESPQHADAFRLLRFLSYFVPMFDENVPETSLLREFVGGSFFHY